MVMMVMMGDGVDDGGEIAHSLNTQFTNATLKANECTVLAAFRAKKRVMLRTFLVQF